MGRAIVNNTADAPDGRVLVNRGTEMPSSRGLVNAYAKGTNNAIKGAAMVGEKGKEIVMMKGGEKVISNKEVPKYMKGKIIKAKFKNKK
jgi:SLT domain-containing protein